MSRLLLLALLLAACEQRVIVGETPDAGDERENWVDLQFGSRTTDVDLLFVVDNSPSMTPKQTELKTRFSSLIAQLEQFGPAYAGHYHIGVITTDLGAGSFTLSNGQCHPGGDRGLLQALGKAANQDCRGPIGVPYIELDLATGIDNLPLGQNLATTFGCMASVGDQGCGFE